MTRRHLAPLAMAFVLGLACVAAAGAQSAPRPTAVQPSVWEQPQPAQQNDFVPVKNLPALQQEHIPAAPLVMVAYAFVWVALLVYVWSVWRRVGAVQRELADLRRRTERKG